jgi:hypothetical protein
VLLTVDEPEHGPRPGRTHLLEDIVERPLALIQVHPSPTGLRRVGHERNLQAVRRGRVSNHRTGVDLDPGHHSCV